jgi:predicted dehydrogenase
VQVQLFVAYGTVEEDRWEIYGDKAKLVVDRYNSLLVDRVPLSASGGIGNAVRRVVSEVAHIGYGLEKRRAPGQEPSYAASLHAFVGAVRAGAQHSPSIIDGVAALRVVLAARGSAQGTS